jgi:hypothetical protein
MRESIDVNRFALVAILVAANARRPDEYPDYEALYAMTDSALLGSARGLLYSIEHSSPTSEVTDDEAPLVGVVAQPT